MITLLLTLSRFFFHGQSKRCGQSLRECDRAG